MKHFALLCCLAATGQTPKLPDLPEAISSFGAAVDDGYLYIYGGHIGKTHDHSTKNHTQAFRRLNVVKGGAWEDLPTGPALQGIVLASAPGRIYRVGGMSAKNEPGQPEDLHSTTVVSSYDPQAKKWTDLPPLPQGNSSHGAQVVDGKLIVFGGWTLAGPGNRKWADKVYELDLQDPKASWKVLAEQPFSRRAFGWAARDGKIVIVGGLIDGGVSNDTDILDLKTRQWSKGPKLPGPPINANGTAGCAQGGDVFVTSFDGNVYRLADKEWAIAGTLDKGRIHHRMLPVGAKELLIVAGAGRGGHYTDLAVIAPK